MTFDQSAKHTEQQAIVHILKNCRSVAVVGLSPKAHRDSYRVAQYLQQYGRGIIAIKPVAAASGGTILGERVYASLSDAAQHETIELVDVFRNSADVPPVVDEAIAIVGSLLCRFPGVCHDAALQKARTAGMVAVQNLCLKVEHARLSIA